MSKCLNENCPGHLGRFQDCESELAHEWSLDCADATTGDVEFQGHLSLVIVRESFTDRLDVGTADARTETLRMGAYLVESTNSGAVYAVHFDDAADARKVFDEADRAYCAWLDADDSEI